MLEIGCGPGVTATLVCDRLTGGHLTGIHRSEKSVALASRRNADHVATGRAESRHARPQELGGTYDRVFSLNVRELWDAPQLVVERVAPGGAALWVFELPSWTDADVDRHTRPLAEAVGGEAVRGEAAFGVRVHVPT